MPNESDHWYDRNKGVPTRDFNEAVTRPPETTPDAGSDMIKKTAPALIHKPTGPGVSEVDALAHGEAMQRDDEKAHRNNEARHAALDRLRDEHLDRDRDREEDRGR